MKKRIASDVRNRLEGPFTAIARAMADKQDIVIQASGTELATDGQVIRFPWNADDIDTIPFPVLNGYLDHEVGHIVEERRHAEAGRERPLQLMKRLAGDKTMQLLINVYEDIRMEIRAGDRHIGVGQNLNAANLYAVEKHRASVAKGEHAPFWHRLSCGIILAARGQSVSWLPEEYNEYMALCAPEIAESQNIEWVQDSHRLALSTFLKVRKAADEILAKEAAKAKEKAEKAKEKHTGDEGDEGGDEGSSADEGDEVAAGEDEDDGAEGGDASDEGDEAGADDDASEGAEGGDEGGDEDGASGSDEGDDGAEDGGEDAADSSHGEASSGATRASDEGEGECATASAEGGDGTGEDDARLELAEATREDATETHLIDAVADEIKRASEDKRDRTGAYMPNPDSLKADRWIKPSESNIGAYNTLKAQVATQTSALRTKLMRVVRTITEARTVYDQDAGTLDTHALHQLRLGNKRVFSQTKKAIELDTAVSILVDMSGSMGAAAGRTKMSRAEHARLTVIALAEAFDALGVPCEIIGFHNDSMRGAPSYKRGFVNRSPLEYFIFKAFHEQHKKVRARLVGIGPRNDNSDGEAVMAVALRLAARPEARKLMFVISDGEPSCMGVPPALGARHLSDTVRKVTRAGIEVFGIGVEHEGIQRFYGSTQGAEYVAIRNIDTMAADIFKIVSKRLTAHIKQRVA